MTHVARLRGDIRVQQMSMLELLFARRAAR